VLFQQLGVDSIFVFSGLSLCTRNIEVAVDPDMAEILADASLCKASLSSLACCLNGNMVKAIQLEYLLRFYVSCLGNNEKREGCQVGLPVGCCLVICLKRERELFDNTQKLSTFLLYIMIFVTKYHR
jgi:hypothetical protein